MLCQYSLFLSFHYLQWVFLFFPFFLPSLSITFSPHIFLFFLSPAFLSHLLHLFLPTTFSSFHQPCLHLPTPLIWDVFPDGVADSFLPGFWGAAGVCNDHGKTYALYAITVIRRNPDSSEDSWKTYRRYSDFHDFHMRITEQVIKMDRCSVSNVQLQPLNFFFFFTQMW